MFFLILKSTVKGNNVLHGDDIIILFLKKGIENNSWLILIMKMANIEQIM